MAAGRPRWRVPRDTTTRGGQRPGYGRYEINTPPRVLPGAESYYRSWSTKSPRGYEFVPPDPPPIIYAPEFRGRRPSR